MRKKQESFALDPLVEFMIDHFKIPAKKEIDKFIKKAEQSLTALKVPTKASFDQLTKRVEALEKAIKANTRATKVATRTKAGRKAATRKKRVSRAKPQLTDSERLLRVMRRYRAGVDVATLKARTGFEDKKIRNIIFRLSKKGKIKRTSRGIYKVVV